MRQKIEGTMKNWENGKLGQDAEFAAEASLEEEMALDDALELKLISIRMQKSLIRKLKLIANYHGIGYQPLDWKHRKTLRQQYLPGASLKPGRSDKRGPAPMDKSKTVISHHLLHRIQFKRSQ